MSHFSVMVALKEGEELEDVMLPYHEYECTGIEEYTEWVDNTEKVEKGWAALKAKDKREYENSISEYAKDYYGCDTKVIDDKVTFGRITNPKAEWDWYVVGGRWENSLKLKDGREVDAALKVEIDIAGPLEKMRQEQSQKFDQYLALKGDQDIKSWEEVRAQCGVEKIDEARNFYHNQEGLKELKQLFGDSFMSPCPIDHFKHGDREAFMNEEQLYYKTHGTYAFLSTETGWVAKGEMGWFGMSHDEKDDWPVKFRELFERLPDDAHIVIVDCHI